MNNSNENLKVEVWIGEETSHRIEIYTDIEIEEMPVYQEEFRGSQEDAVKRAKVLVRDYSASGLEVHHPDGRDTVVVM